MTASDGKHEDDSAAAGAAPIAFKHTPGPWAVEDPMGPDILSIIANGDSPVYEWRHIAQLTLEAPEDRFDPTIVEQEANARLLASAPDLLVALQAAYTYISQPQRMTSTEAVYRAHNYNTLTAQIRAAIARATS